VFLTRGCVKWYLVTKTQDVLACDRELECAPQVAWLETGRLVQ